MEAIPMRKHLLSALFLTALNGCTTVPKVVTETHIQYELAPQSLLKTCPQVYVPWNNTGDIINENTALKGALSTCATQITGLQAWNQTLLKKNGAAVKHK
jgi:hypothetical protein